MIVKSDEKLRWMVMIGRGQAKVFQTMEAATKNERWLMVA